MISRTNNPEYPPVVPKPQFTKLSIGEKDVLRRFRVGQDTAMISKIRNEHEAVTARLLSSAREIDRANKLSQRS